MAKIVLASGSPRRQELLQRIGITDFDIRVPQTEETYPAGLSPRETVEYISREKSDAAAALCTPEEIVITADTMVFLDGLRLGKPHSREEARAMLRSLSGREHQVCTGVTVCRGDRADTRCESTAVHFRPLADREIESYIDTGEPMDKAGAYGIQGLGALFVEGIRGDYCNVMGLPLFLLGRMLSDFGVDLLGGGEEP